MRFSTCVAVAKAGCWAPCILLALLWSTLAYAGDVTLVAVMGQKAIVEINGERHVLGIGQGTPDGVRLLSVDENGAEFQIGKTRERFTIGAHSGYSANFAVPETAEARIAPDPSGMYFSHGSINGKPVRFLVDTGATGVSLSTNEARRIGIDYKRVGYAIQIATANGMTRGWRLTLDRVKVGGIELFGVDAAVIDGPDAGITLLGNSFLNRLEMVRDNGVMLLRQR